MKTFNAIHNAIMVRQAERMNRCEPPMTEMWLPPETYDQLVEEGKAMCVAHDPAVTKTALCGVELRRMTR